MSLFDQECSPPHAGHLIRELNGGVRSRLDWSVSIPVETGVPVTGQEIITEPMDISFCSARRHGVQFIVPFSKAPSSNMELSMVSDFSSLSVVFEGSADMHDTHAWHE
jgi:hypothetical protein